MRPRNLIIIIMSLTIPLVPVINAQIHDFQTLTGPYFGQQPPGKTPELFADSIIANRYKSFHTSLMFSSDGTACYWQAEYTPGEEFIAYSNIENERWTTIEIAPFSKIGYRDDAPFISPDGTKLFFISIRPLEKGVESHKENIWVMERSGKSWGEPKPLPQLINSIPRIHWQMSVDSLNNLYFSAYQKESRGFRGNIYCSEFVNGEYTEPVMLDHNINTSDYEFSPFISPDGSYLLFSRQLYGKGSCRIFISFRNEDDTWGEAINLYDTYGIKGICPIVSNDNKYLFFLDYVKSHSQPFWVDASFIEKLRLK
ncbi:MAG: hypothetical protein ABIJ12_06060 [bacterium]